MRMKDKITRAFTQDKPNVLRQVLKDCPEKVDSHPRPRKRLSDRAVGIISTAASLALIITTVFGGVAYFRNEYGNTLQSGSAPSGGISTPDTIPDPPISPTDPSDLIVEPHPDNTVDYDNSIDGLITRTDDILYPLELRDSEYQVPDVPVDPIEEYGVEMYRIRREFDGYCFQFLFHAKSGILLKMDVIPCDCIKLGQISPYAAAWIAAMDLAPEHFGLTQHLDYDIQMEGSDAYRIQLDWVVPTIYYINIWNGNILYYEQYQPTPEYISVEEARNAALKMHDHPLEDVRTFKVYENGDMYEVYYEYGEYAYCFHINALDGTVIYDEGATRVGWRPSEFMEHLITWQKCRDLCLEACGRELKELIGFSWEYIPGDPDVYSIELTFADDYFQYRVDALDGTFAEDVGMVVIPEDKISEMVVYRAGLTEDEKAQLLADVDVDYSCDLVVQGHNYYYEVYMRIGSKYFYYEIDAVYGNFLVEETPETCPDIMPPDGDIGLDNAVQIALEYAGYTQDQITDLASKYDDRVEGSYCYWIYFSVGSHNYEISVHAYSGEILWCNGNDVDAPDTP